MILPTNGKSVIILIIMAVAANTMAMTARERMSEYATLKALGFKPGKVAALIMGEAFLLALVGAGIGIGIGEVAGKAAAAALAQPVGHPAAVRRRTRAVAARARTASRRAPPAPAPHGRASPPARCSPAARGGAVLRPGVRTTRQEGIEPPTCRFGDGCSAN